MYVIFNDGGCDKAMICFYNDQDRQSKMMHKLDVDKQVKEWQLTNSGNPRKFYSRINIKEFTNKKLNLIKR